MSAPTIDRVRCTCPSMPTQYEGTLSDGRCFYFRYRSWRVQFGIGATVEDAVRETFDDRFEQLHYYDFGGPGAGTVFDLDRPGDGHHNYGELSDDEVRQLLPQLLAERLARG